MFGWNGKLLRINLSDHTESAEDIDPKVAKDYIGGRGWAIRYLYDEVDPTVDPLDAENKLIFVAGPLVGTGAVAAASCNVSRRARYRAPLSAPRQGDTSGRN